MHGAGACSLAHWLRRVDSSVAARCWAASALHGTCYVLQARWAARSVVCGSVSQAHRSPLPLAAALWRCRPRALGCRRDLEQNHSTPYLHRPAAKGCWRRYRATRHRTKGVLRPFPGLPCTVHPASRPGCLPLGVAWSFMDRARLRGGGAVAHVEGALRATTNGARLPADSAVRSVRVCESATGRWKRGGAVRPLFQQAGPAIDLPAACSLRPYSCTLIDASPTSRATQVPRENSPQCSVRRCPDSQAVMQPAGPAGP